MGASVRNGSCLNSSARGSVTVEETFAISRWNKADEDIVTGPLLMQRSIVLFYLLTELAKKTANH